MTLEGWRIFVDVIGDVARIGADVIGYVAWPIVALVALWVFYRPVVLLLGGVEKLTWGDKSVEMGRRSQDLLRDAQQSSSSEGGGDVTFSELIEAVSPSSTPVVAETPEPDSVPETASTDLQPTDFIVFYRRIVMKRLRDSKYNTNTTSRRLSAEIVGSTYADLKQTVRVVTYVLNPLHPADALAEMPVTLRRLGLPEKLYDDIRMARSFAHDVMQLGLPVDGAAADNYIDTVVVLVDRLTMWAARSSVGGSPGA